MKIIYARISSLGQNPERQQTNEKEYDKVLTDTISGTVPFFERPKGMIIKEMLEESRISELHVQSIDRLGRNLISTLQTIEAFNSYSVPIVIKEVLNSKEWYLTNDSLLENDLNCIVLSISAFIHPCSK